MDAIAIRKRLVLPKDASDEELAAALRDVLNYLASLDRPECGLSLNSQSAPDDVLDAVRMQTDRRLVDYRRNMVLMQHETEVMRARVSRSISRQAVDAAAAKGCVIPRPVIDTLVELHMQKPDEAVALMKCLPHLLLGNMVQGPVTQKVQAETLG